MAYIIVLGRNYLTSLSALRSLGKAGHIVDLIYIAFRKDGNIVSSCKYIHKYTEVQDAEEIMDVLRAKGTGTDQTKPVLFPTDDHTAELIDRNRTELSEQFIMPFMYNSSGEHQLIYYMDKTVQQEIAQACGLKTAKSWIINLEQKTYAIPADMEFPCFVKPLVSANGGKSDIGKCDSLTDLQMKLEKLAARGRRQILVQEYLDISQEYVIGGVCKDRAVLIPAVIRKTKVAKQNSGITLSGVLEEKTILPAEVLSSVEKTLQAIRYTGPFDFELNVVNGDYYFGEINFRIGGPSYIYTLCGANLPDLSIKALCSESINASYNLVTGKSFYNDKVLWEDYFARFLTQDYVKKCQKELDYSLAADPDDPLPGKLYYKKIQKRLFKDSIKKIIGRTS